MQKARNDYWRSRFERVQAEKQMLKERLVSSKKENNDLQKKLRSKERLFDSIPAGILLEQEGKIVAANREFLEGLGYAPEEVIGRRLLDFVPLDLKACAGPGREVSVLPLQADSATGAIRCTMPDFA